MASVIEADRVLSVHELVEAAASRAEYAAWRFDSVRTFGDEAWCTLPTTENGALRPGIRSTCAANVGDIVYFSSGTTGAQKSMFFSTRDVERVSALCARFASFEGIGPRDRVMVLLPMTLWGVGRFTSRGHLAAGAQVCPVDLHGGVAMWQQLASAIVPTVISSTPSVLETWAREYRGPTVRVLETTGEVLDRKTRETIETAFGGGVRDAYGLSECVVGVECSAEAGFHYWPDTVGVEVIDTCSDHPVEAGAIGEIVVTSFLQERMPVVRYRTGDLGWLTDDRCRCGSSLPRLLLSGRCSETYRLPRGVSVMPHQLAQSLVVFGCADVTLRLGPDMHVAPFVGPRQATIEIVIDEHGEKSAALAALFSSHPELAELVHENQLAVQIETRSS
jgi:phenylacetate-CoA ligase